MPPLYLWYLKNRRESSNIYYFWSSFICIHIYWNVSTYLLIHRNAENITCVLSPASYSLWLRGGLLIAFSVTSILLDFLEAILRRRACWIYIDCFQGHTLFQKVCWLIQSYVILPLIIKIGVSFSNFSLFKHLIVFHLLLNVCMNHYDFRFDLMAVFPWE
jgi:hypothetical protein